MTKSTKWNVRHAETHISLSLISSDTSMCAKRAAYDLKYFHADSKDSAQTRRMPRLIRIFVGRLCYLVGFVLSRLKYTYDDVSRKK